MTRSKLESDLTKAIISDFVRYSHLSGNRINELSQLQFYDLLFRYVNWVKRFGPAAPVEVLFAKGTRNDARFKTYQKCISEITRRLQFGEPLLPFLSNRVQKSSYILGSESKHSDKDRLLNSEGIIHLHLGTKVKGEKLYGYQGDLLFLKTQNHTAYILGIGNHEEFSSGRWAKVAIENWPKSGLYIELKGMFAGSSLWTDKEVDELRKAGASTPIQVKDKLYTSSNLGISTAGISVFDTQIVKKFLQGLEQIQTTIEEFEVEILKEINDHYDLNLTKLIILTKVNIGEVQITEKQSGHIFYDINFRHTVK